MLHWLHHCCLLTVDSVGRGKKEVKRRDRKEKKWRVQTGLYDAHVHKAHTVNCGTSVYVLRDALWVILNSHCEIPLCEWPWQTALQERHNCTKRVCRLTGWLGADCQKCPWARHWGWKHLWFTCTLVRLRLELRWINYLTKTKQNIHLKDYSTLVAVNLMRRPWWWVYFSILFTLSVSQPRIPLVPMENINPDLK